MPRYTLDDGKVRRFWAIQRDGSTLHMTTGELGSEGRTRSKSWRTEDRAKTEEEKAVQTMVRLGYVEEREKSALSDALDRAMRDRSPASLKVLADWLLEQGDPWGPVLAEGLAHPDREPAGQAALSAAWFPSPDAVPTWEAGRVVRLELDTVRADALRDFFASPAGRLLDTLSVRGFRDPILPEIAAPSGLHHLKLRETHADFSPCATTFPWLRSLDVHGTDLVLGAPKLPSLEVLRIERGSPVLGQARFGDLGALREVSIVNGGNTFGDDLGRFLAGKSVLEAVDLEGFDASTTLVRWFQAGVPSTLKKLRIVRCSLTPEDSEQLERLRYEHPHVHLDIRHILPPPPPDDSPDEDGYYDDVHE